MKKQISRVSVFQSSRVVSLLYFFFGLPPAVAGLFLVLFTENPENRIPGIVFLLMPVILSVMGFVFLSIMIAIYNFLASKVGGIEFETSEAE
ncbi:hypothetical protein L21SP3_01047 [Sedimentisphaera cyanobacteriorum]|uniref:DUF3566 domain-containing protein n=1 Tax=Sedimentisphaera cyanobacteriorum TaxID=1940790 RepID=A0A1Q2HPS7_9BACT|nr:hypothetical protein [Sedimentisphaera cyanobacteriorum]AQQ09245.1 hypothetical protein L21SP3_01047 [Sedimentisphaera cyanobacteriorum]